MDRLPQSQSDRQAIAAGNSQIPDWLDRTNRDIARLIGGFDPTLPADVQRAIEELTYRQLCQLPPKCPRCGRQFEGAGR